MDNPYWADASMSQSVREVFRVLVGQGGRGTVRPNLHGWYYRVERIQDRVCVATLDGYVSGFEALLMGERRASKIYRETVGSNTGSRCE
jgi:hypothetical protein